MTALDEVREHIATKRQMGALVSVHEAAMLEMADRLAALEMRQVQEAVEE